MSAFTLTGLLVALMVPGKRYYLADLCAMPALAGTSNKQVRNALLSLQCNGRVLHEGSRGSYRYHLNAKRPIAAGAAAQLALRDTTVDAILRAQSEGRPALAPAWPANRRHHRTFGAPMMAVREALPC